MYYTSSVLCCILLLTYPIKVSIAIVAANACCPITINSVGT